MNTESQGFITLAFGAKYAELALDMALSLRQFHDEPVSIAVDNAAGRRLARYKRNPFDKIIALPQNVHAWGAKFLIADATPYARNAYVDADVLFLGRSPFFDFNYTAPLAMYGAYMPADKDCDTYYSTKQMCADFGLRHYFWATSGVFLFKKEGALEMFRSCYEFYTAGIKNFPRYASGLIPDEMVFGIMGEKYAIDSIIPKAHPWPSVDAMKTITPSERTWPVFHAFAPPSTEYWNFLMAEVCRRRKALGYPMVSEEIWKHKAYSIPSFWDKLSHVNRKFWRKFGIG